VIFGPTHWNVLRQVKVLAQLLCTRFERTWNTYENHPYPYYLDDISVDFWGRRGRGSPVGRRAGRRIARALIHQHGHGIPICYIRWRGRIWHPRDGWRRFNPDGIGHYDHVHVTFNLYSNTAEGYCPWRGL
jgi:hypothetical protein